jgi:hypothetical protein
MLGLSTREIHERFDEIVAGLREFSDAPVNTAHGPRPNAPDLPAGWTSVP